MPKIASPTPITTNAPPPFSRQPAKSTSSHATIQDAGMSASARIRRRPSIRREIGSCATTITIVFKKKSAPI